MPAKSPTICVVGSVNMDLTFQAPRLPRAGETLAGRLFHMGFGGKGANQAVMAARLGARVNMIGRVGNDIFGEQLRDNFLQQGIDTTHLRQDPDRSSGVAAILVDGEARNCIVVVPGANGELCPQDVLEAAPVIRSADVLLGQLEVPVETTLEAFRLARAAGVRTILNPAPAADLPEELLQLTDICVPNETEVEMLWGRSLASLRDIEEAGQALRQRGPGIVIVTLGERGSLLLSEQGAGLVPTVKVTAVDSSGAGDAFIGSLAVFVVEGLSFPEAVERANGVAALSVTRKGTQTSFPSRAEVGEFWKTAGEKKMNRAEGGA